MDLLERMKQLKEEQEKKFQDKKSITIKKKEIKEQQSSRSYKRIPGDKDLNKEEICNYLANLILTNKDNFTLDWLRGQKLTFDSVNEMRKVR